MRDAEGEAMGIIGLRCHDDFVVPRCDDFLEILYEDDDILLINKPSGILSLSGKHPLNWDSVHYRLVNGQDGVSEGYPEAKLPHRLDLGTSGIMVVGLHDGASRCLNRQFQERAVRKRYMAMLEGWVSDDVGQIDLAIVKGGEDFPRVKLCEVEGKSAVTDYSVIRRVGDVERSLVEYRPVTGRTHQLRIHSAAIGHPILGCDLYHSETSREKADRLLLHACDLYFHHPGDYHGGEEFHGFCPCPFVDV